MMRFGLDSPTYIHTRLDNYYSCRYISLAVVICCCGRIVGPSGSMDCFNECIVDYTATITFINPNTQIVNGEFAYLVVVTRPDGLKVKTYYDAKTGLKVKQYTDVPGSSINEFSDYRAINGGIKIPYKYTTNLIGDQAKFEVTNAVANSELGDGEFR